MVRTRHALKRNKFTVANCVTICYNIANKIGVDMLAKLLGSQVRAAILRVLFTEERCEVHLRELARRTGFSAPCLMREAKMLVGEALIIEDKRENRSYYRANEKSPLYLVLVELVAKTSSGETIITRQFKSSPSEVIFIYGSRAKGTAKIDSDYDLFVLGEEGLRSVVARISEIRDLVGVEINPYVITKAEFVKRVKAGDHFLTEVLKEKKIFIKGGEDELAEFTRELRKEVVNRLSVKYRNLVEI